MENVIFYQPPSTSTSQPPHFPNALAASIVSGGSITPISARQTASQLSPRDEMWKDHMIRYRDMSAPSQERHSPDQRYRNDTAQEQGSLTAARISSTSDDDDDFPAIDELLSGVKQKNISASANLNSDDDDSFLDVDEFLAGIQQKSVSASVKPNSGGMAKKVDNRTRGDSPVETCPSTGSIQDPIILSDDKSVGSESKTDYSNLDVDLVAKSYSDSLHSAETELEDKGFEVFEGNDEADEDTRSTKRSALSAVSCNDPVFDSNISDLQDDQHDHSQSSQLSLVVASLPQSDLKNDRLPKRLHRRDSTRNVRCKRPRTTAPIGLASAVSAALEPTDLEEPQSRALITAPGQEMVDGITDDSDGMSYATGSKIGGRPCSQKRVRRTEDTEDNDVKAPSTHPVDASYQAIAATSSGSMQESEEIPIHGYFTLQTMKSKVVYSLTFSQELLSRPRGRRQRQDITTDVKEPQSAALVVDPNHLWGIGKVTGRKIVDDEKHYKLRWEETWMPESELAGAKELIDEFEAELQHAQGGSRRARQKRPKMEDNFVIGRPDARGETVLKKRRGRPRKQTTVFESVKDSA